MKQAGYPARLGHIVLRGELLKRTRAISQEALPTKETETVFKLLKDWWLGHINGEDRKYAPHVKNLLAM